ncbi:MAG: hypothetical protein E7634_04625 [Ruminococcaceae bacterium]|nr:hypothetical protein [Oscillospiraceae bacterium]
MRMKILFLGTGAADTKIERYQKGEFIRRYSSALIDGELLIDPGPHVFHFAENEGRPNALDNVKNIIVTHSHRDHFCEETVYRLSQKRKITLWADPVCKDMLAEKYGESIFENVAFVETAVRKSYEIGGYKVLPLRANHYTGKDAETARVYIIEKDGRELFYGTDTSGYPTESWNILRKHPINLMVMELTCGKKAYDDFRIFEHTTLELLEFMMRVIKKYGYFAQDVRYVTTHMAVTLHEPHEELKETLGALGIVPAYDGFETEV